MWNYKKSIKKIPGSLSAFKAFKQILETYENISQSISSARSPFVKAYPPGHHYSPFPDLTKIQNEALNDGVDKAGDLPAIDLREEHQIALIKTFSCYYKDIPFSAHSKPGLRYYFENHYFSYADGVILFLMLRHLKPGKIVEIGSGYSSAHILDTNEMFFDSKIDVTFIEPYPARLKMLLQNKDSETNCTIIEKPLQSVSLEMFRRLEKNDILFIDSSHVVKPGSDVMRIFFHILPILSKGVVVHFHDICWPFEYPGKWFAAGRAWNESYVLRAFMQFNNSFKVLYYTSFMNKYHASVLEEFMPLCLNTPEDKMVVGASSFWMIREK